MRPVNEIQMYRLQRAQERLKMAYEKNAPSIIIKIELLLIKEICDNLIIALN